MVTAPQPSPNVAIVGGGLAGLAAACALADAGFHITLIERRPYLGGRASSYEHPGTGEVVDNCQHVLLGCCTNLLDFYRRIGVEEKIRWYEQLTFIEPGGRRSEIGPARWLPAPFHNVSSFLLAPALGMADKASITRAMFSLARSLPADRDENFLDWLQRHGQTQPAINRFWKVVLVSALNERLERMSARSAAQVFRESFLKSAEAGRMGVPRVPLSELYSAAGDYIRARGGEVHLRLAVDTFRPAGEKIRLCISENETETDFGVLAVPFETLARILPEVPSAQPLREMLAHFESSPITGIHLWFDRQITDLDHAVLMDRTIQWMFHKSKLLDSYKSDTSYVELVVSASTSLVPKSRTEILELALCELPEFFPQAAKATLVKGTVIKEVHATYSPLPDSDAYRPQPQTAWDRVFLSGDSTATGWPATMEGAVRSGYQAAEALATRAGLKARFLVPELPARGLMKLLK